MFNLPALPPVMWTTPGMLWGLGLVALPIVAHLMRRRARRRVVLPSVAMLVETSREEASLRRPRRWLLLVVRCLLVIAIALAFARPVWRGLGASGVPGAKPSPTQGAVEGGGGSEGVGVVLLLDGSASMGQRLGGVDTVESLRPMAGRVLDSLQPGTDAAAVVVIGGDGRRAAVPLTRNLAAVRGELAGWRAGGARGDAAAAVAWAGELLRDHRGPRRLVVLSDLQASGWADVAEAGSGGLPAGTRVTVVDAGAAGGDNVTLARPKVAPGTPGRTMRASVEVLHRAAGPLMVPVTLSVDGHLAETQLVPMDGDGRAVEVGFDLMLHEPGDHRLRFEADVDDALKIDNVAFAVARVEDRPRVAVVAASGEEASGPGSPAYVAARSLAPRSSLEDRFRVVSLLQEEVDAEALEGLGVVVLGDVQALPAPAAEGLRGFMDGGGSVMLLGDTDVKALLETLTNERSNEAGGLRVSGFDPGDAATSSGVSLGVDDAASPLLRGFDERSRLALAGVSVQRRWSLTLEGSGGGDRGGWAVLLRFADGSPAVVRRDGAGGTGAGSLVAVAFGVGAGGEGATGLAGSGAVVPLMQAMVLRLRRGGVGPAAGLVGEPLVFIMSRVVPRAGQPLQVTGPGGEPIAPARVRVASSANRSIASAVLDRAAEPGVYEATRGDAALLAAANPDPREGDLRRLETDAVAAMLEGGGADRGGTPARLAGDVPARGVELWGWLLLIAMALAAAEAMLRGPWGPWGPWGRESRGTGGV